MYMLMFNEDIKARDTTYDINFLTVSDFQEIYFDVYELVINGNKYIAEKVSEYQGMPVVTIPVTINGIAEDASFVLKKGTQEVLFNKNNSLTHSNIPSTDTDFLDSLNEDSISEISNLYIDSKAINEELEKAKLSAAEYAKAIKEQKIEEATQAIERKKKDAKKEIESYKKDLLSEFYGLTEDIRSSLHESNTAEQLVIRKNVSETLEILSEELDTRIEKASAGVKKFYDNKIKLIEESVLDITKNQRDNVIAIINESKQSLLDQINTITVPQSSVIVERDGRSTLDLKELKKEIENKITAKFSAEMGSLKRYIELSSGGGSVAQQFSNGGTMNGSLTVTGTISASQYLGIVTSTGNEVLIGGNSAGTNMVIGTNDNFNLNLETAGTTKMTVTSAGNVGIGTSEPTSNFQVNQSTSGIGTISMGAASNGINGVGTQFLNTFRVGDTITSAGQTLTISSIASNTSMISVLPSGAAISNQPYTLVGGTKFNVSGNGDVFIRNVLAPQLRIVADSGNTSFYGLSIEAANNLYAGILANSQSGEIKIGAFNNGGYYSTFYSNNAERMRIAPAGNVGIGRTAPLARLDVNGTTFINATGDGGTGAMLTVGGSGSTIYTPGAVHATGGLVLSSGNNVSQVSIAGGNIVNLNGLQIANGGPVLSYLSSSGIKVLQANGTTYGSVNAGTLALGSSYAGVAAPTNGAIIEGSVGIGTTAPKYLFSVKPNSGQPGQIGFSTLPTFASPALYLEDYSGTVTYKFGQDNSGALKLLNNGNTVCFETTAGLSTTISGNSTFIQAGNSTVTIQGNFARILFDAFTTNAIQFFSGSTTTERMRILGSNGNVGIGTTTPTEKLQVAGAIRVSGDFATWSANTGALFYAGGKTGLLSSGPDTSTVGGFLLRCATSDGSGTAFNALTIEPTGCVGIGNVTPTNYTFSVNTTPFTGTTGNWGKIGRVYMTGSSFGSYPDIGYNIRSVGGSYVFDVGDSAAWITIDGNFRFKTAGSGAAGAAITATERLTILASNGNVGIGATNPVKTLQLGDGTTVSPNLFFYANEGSGNPEIRFATRNNYDNFSVSIFTTGDPSFLSIGGRNSSTTLSSTLNIYKNESRVDIPNNLSGSILNILGSTVENSATIFLGSPANDTTKNSRIVFGATTRVEGKGGIFYTPDGTGFNRGNLDIVVDTNTNSLNLTNPTTSGVTGIRLTSIGNVGLGTASPTANFQVNQSVNGTGTISVAAGSTTVNGTSTQFLNTFKVGDTITSAGQTLTITAISSNTSMTTSAAGVAITSQPYTLTGGTRFSVLGNGNVLIPNTLELNTLVPGVGAVKPVLTIYRNGSGGDGSSILCKRDGGQEIGDLRFSGTAAAPDFGINLRYNYTAQSNLATFTQNTSGRGSVVFGTFNGLNNASLSIFNSIFAQNTVGLILGNCSSGANSNIDIVFQNFAADPHATIRGVYSGTTKIGSLAFLTANGSTPVEALRITQTGNVGVGTPSPASKVTVTGGDIELTDASAGVIFKTPDGTKRYRMTIDNAGAPVFTLLP